MNLTATSHFTSLWDVKVGDLVTHYAAETGDPTTFEVLSILPTASTALVALDTSLGAVQALAGTIVEVFDGFDFDAEVSE